MILKVPVAVAVPYRDAGNRVARSPSHFRMELVTAHFLPQGSGTSRKMEVARRALKGPEVDPVGLVDVSSLANAAADLVMRGQSKAFSHAHTTLTARSWKNQIGRSGK